MSEGSERVERAVSRFKKGFSCSQALVSAYGPDFGLEDEYALRISSPFAGGIGNMGETCGAVTGALMVLGLLTGKAGVEDEKTIEEIQRTVKRFIEEFKARNGSVTCRELLGCDISTGRGMTEAQLKGLFHRRCPMFVRDAAEIIEKLLEAGEKGERA